MLPAKGDLNIRCETRQSGRLNPLDSHSSLSQNFKAGFLKVRKGGLPPLRVVSWIVLFWPEN
jgi:hypothetical protein